MATLAPNNDVIRDLFITGLKNAHGVEKQALQLMDRQLERLEQYPEVAEMLQRHRVETEGQLTRIDELLAGFDTSASGLKDAALSLSGNMAAILHAPADDEIIKNSLANHAFENFEIAAYTSLLALADHAGVPNATSALQQSLQEEQRMAQLILESIPSISVKYANLLASGEQASR